MRLRRALTGDAASELDARAEDLPALAMRRRRLEQELAEAQLQSATARDDLSKVYKVLELFKQKYSELATAKAEAAKQVIAAEQARLEMSRALLTTKTEASKVGELREVERYRAESELLAANDAKADLETRLDDALRQAGQLTEAHADAESLTKDRDAKARQLDTFEARNLELSTELLSLVAQRDDLSQRLRLAENEANANVAAAATVKDERDGSLQERDSLSSSLQNTKETMDSLALKHATLQVELFFSFKKDLH